MTTDRDANMEFSSDENDLEMESEIPYENINPTCKLTLGNRSHNLLGFHSLPPELLYYIFSFLDIKVILQEVRFVSRYFFDFLSSKDYWDLRFSDCLKSVNANNFNLIISHDEYTMLDSVGISKSTFMIETAKTLTYNKNLKCYKMKTCHYGDVHCAKMLIYSNKSLAVSGSRDKTICIYNLDNLDNENEVVVNTNTDHNGWVWTLDQENGNSSKLASGSWDSYVNIYEIGRGSMEKVSNISVNSAVLCSRFEHNFLLYGTYSKIVAGYDTRCGKVIFKLRNHTKPVLGLTSSDNFIWSTGEDHALSCYDRRAGKLFKRIRLERISSSVQYLEPYLWVGGYDGLIKCFKSNMKLINKYNSNHSIPITDMRHCIGATVTSSKDGSVKIFSPNVQTEEWNKFQLDNEASCVDYNNGILMAGCCDNTVTFWKHDSI